MMGEHVTDRGDATTGESRSRVDLGVTLLAAAIAAVLVLPVGWLVFDVLGLLVFDALGQGTQALSYAFAPRTLDVMVTSVALVAVVTAASALLGVPLAILTVQVDIPFPRFWTVLCALPLAVPSYLGAFAFVSAFGPRGELADVLRPLGIETIPSVSGFAGAAFVLTLYSYPYVFLTTRASLLSLDGSLLEAARTLNSGRWESFRRVTLAQILPGVAAGSLLVALYTLADFGTPNIMRVEVFTQVIYANHEGLAREYASILSLQLLAVTAVILAIESRIGADDSGAYASRGKRGAGSLSVGAGRYAALLVPAIVALVALVVPIAIFGSWLTGGGSGYGSVGPTFSWVYAWNSATLATLAAIASVVLAIPIAIASARSSGTLASLADRATYVGYATPGIVLAIALISFSLDLLPAVESALNGAIVATGLGSGFERGTVVRMFYRTVPMLIFAYVVRFMPQTMGSIRTSAEQVDRKLSEAARTLGSSRLRAFRTVTLPLILPGVAAGAALVFLTTMKELPVTLLLLEEFDTLVTFIWRVEGTAQYGKAAVPALVLVVISGLSMAVILAQEGR